MQEKTYRAANTIQIVEKIFGWIALKKGMITISQNAPERMSISSSHHRGFYKKTHKKRYKMYSQLKLPFLS